jgi:hypothetical protein
MFSKHKTFVLLFTEMMSLFLAEQFLGWSNDTDFIEEGEMAELVKKEMVFGCLVIFFHIIKHTDPIPWCHDNLHLPAVHKTLSIFLGKGLQ